MLLSSMIISHQQSIINQLIMSNNPMTVNPIPAITTPQINPQSFQVPVESDSSDDEVKHKDQVARKC